MNSIWFRLKKWWFTKVLRQQWRYICLPNIKEPFQKFDAAEFVSVQPMSNPRLGALFYMETMSSDNPKIGQIFHGVEKNPHNHGKEPCMCCLRGPTWDRIWTPLGWVHEKDGEEAYKAAVEKYHEPYMKREKEQFEKMCKGEKKSCLI